jgi:hypothetical protein
MIWDVLVKLLIACNGFALLAFGIGQLLINGKRAVNCWSFAFFTYSAVVATSIPLETATVLDDAR